MSDAFSLDVFRSHAAACLPPGVSLQMAIVGAQQPALHPLEEVAAAGMADSRRREFAAGRACARLALAELGFGAPGIARGPDREPLWPAGAVGSIAHNHRLAAAALARSGELRSIGIDLEDDGPLEEEVIATILRPAECRRLRAAGTLGSTARLVFSAKESVYKCLWPLCRTFLDFRDVELDLDLAGRSFTASTEAPVARGLTPGLAGRWCAAGGMVFTAAWIGGPGAGV